MNSILNDLNELNRELVSYNEKRRSRKASLIWNDSDQVGLERRQVEKPDRKGELTYQIDLPLNQSELSRVNF